MFISTVQEANSEISVKCREYAQTHGLLDGLASEDGVGCDFKTELSNSVRYGL